MKKSYVEAYETYTQIQWELHRPIDNEDFDYETLKRLYESKILYLESLRVKCFLAINQHNSTRTFTIKDFQNILLALQTTKEQLRNLVENSCSRYFCLNF